MTEKSMMISKLSITAMVLIMTIVGCVVAFNNRTDKSSGALTMDNYSKYLRIQISPTSSSSPKSGQEKVIYLLTIYAEKYHNIPELSFTYIVKGTNVVEESATTNKLSVTPAIFATWVGDVLLNNVPSSWVLDDADLSLTVTSISGRYAYCF
ncbi:MAG: hypothetical protein LKJ88_03210 [Bacilli bacterium]|jgi:uncharacterized lipoprotein NlpE involved in copper resistance|nr:hypothetical protein [Bacilli bacterium]